MKTIAVIAIIALSSTIANAKRAPKADACETAVYRYAIEKQHEDYPGKQFKKSQPGDPEVTVTEEKHSGFEIWSVQYGVNEECLEGYDVLVRRAADGNSCKVLKETSETSQDCG